MTTLRLIKSMGRSPLRLGLLLIPLVLVCFAFSPTARAVSPPPDGGYPNNNTAEGSGALFSLTTGTDNTAIGFNALYSNTGGGFYFYGNRNTAVGSQALFSNTTGVANTANGYAALYSNTTGDQNTATGYFALWNNTTGNENTANGMCALQSNTTGNHNTATGYFALSQNTTGNENTANGLDALLNNTTGNQNTATGYSALQNNTLGSNNTATGAAALFHNTGNGNTATGYSSLQNNTIGTQNTANGVGALRRNQTGNGNTAEGFQALTNNTGSFNVAVGFTAGANLTTGRDNIHIGHPGVAGESNTMRIGNAKQTATFINGIRGVTTRMANATPVLIDSSGQLGTMSSSKRFKNEIKPMDKASDAILALKPVTFHYKSDAGGTPQFGLIAEEVAEVNQDLVVRDENGEIYTVRYEAVNAMLLNEFLKEHGKVEKLETTVARQQKQIEALTAGLQKVSAQIEASQTAPQVVNNP